VHIFILVRLPELFHWGARQILMPLRVGCHYSDSGAAFYSQPCCRDDPFWELGSGGTAGVAAT